ncbi:MAG: hypothetical protein M3Z54_00775 [Gemmatimonadota bacterium]|nr:hypothetical protein [Gemmatimonadota bacterium]
MDTRLLTRVHTRNAGAVAASTEHQGETLRAKLSDWLHRYGLAECAGLSCALLVSVTVRRVTGDGIAAAYGGALGESVGYSTVIILRDYLAAARGARAAGRLLGVGDAGKITVGLLAEFGPSAFLDTLVIRPFAMGVGMRLIGPRLGLIAGKFAADIFFYLPVILIYERRKRISRKRIVRS